jgi:hypothetical protein
MGLGLSLHSAEKCYNIVPVLFIARERVLLQMWKNATVLVLKKKDINMNLIVCVMLSVSFTFPVNSTCAPQLLNCVVTKEEMQSKMR